ncbi:MAG TPA: response regulator [Firmicutes bacterium]|jgi:two-component system response regulator DctR|nr:response regulator [Bacillota bacterium]
MGTKHTVEPKPTVLCIDDDPGILYTFQAIGEVAGWRVVTARTGRSGLRMVVEGGVDIVVVDYHLPDMDGLATVRRIRQRNGRLPILVLTVDESHALATQFLAEGATDFALKPIKAPDLISRINVHLKYSRQAAERNPGLRQRASGERARQLAETLPDISGVNRPTLFAVLEELVAAEQPVTANDIAKAIGCAYPTACRYLNFLESEGVCDVVIDYGGVGRPSKLYTIPRE